MTEEPEINTMFSHSCWVPVKQLMLLPLKGGTWSRSPAMGVGGTKQKEHWAEMPTARDVSHRPVTPGWTLGGQKEESSV